MSDLVGIPEDRFSHNQAQISRTSVSDVFSDTRNDFESFLDGDVHVSSRSSNGDNISQLYVDSMCSLVNVRVVSSINSSHNRYVKGRSPWPSG